MITMPESSAGTNAPGATGVVSTSTDLESRIGHSNATSSTEPQISDHMNPSDSAVIYLACTP
jgi:hypothetical protein